MTHIKYIKTALLLLGVFTCNSCADSYNIDNAKEFVEHHGKEDFSIFDGVNTMFYRGTQDSISLIGGIILLQKGEIESWVMTNIYYNVTDSIIVKFLMASEGWIDSTYTSVDSTYINNLTRRFVELDIYEICMDDPGIIRIHLNEHPQSLVVRFDNDSIKNQRSKECKWKKISDQWYAPEF